MSIVKDNILFHNVEELEKTSMGYKLYRYPREVRRHLNERARFMAQYVCGCELRFVTESERIHINLTAQGSGLILAIVFKGDYVHSVQQLEADKNTLLEIVDRPIPESAHNAFYKDNNFDKNVWRVHLHNCLFTIHSINTMDYDIRPPYPDEMPKKTMLAYGSSITHGAVAVTHTNSYAEEAARILGVDILNKGVGGSCQFEPEVADFFAKDKTWNFAWIEGAVNSTLFEPEEFKKRFDYFIDTLHETGRPVFMTTILPNASLVDKTSEHHERCIQFDEIIRGKKDKGIVIEGNRIITDLRFLSLDTIHPSNEGHTRMGINLAQILKEYL